MAIRRVLQAQSQRYSITQTYWNCNSAHRDNYTYTAPTVRPARMYVCPPVARRMWLGVPRTAHDTGRPCTNPSCAGAPQPHTEVSQILKHHHKWLPRPFAVACFLVAARPGPQPTRCIPQGGATENACGQESFTVCPSSHTGARDPFSCRQSLPGASALPDTPSAAVF